MAVGEVPPASELRGSLRLRAAQEMGCKSIFLFGREPIFSSRPCRSCRHGAQGRVKAGRRSTPRRGLDVSRPGLDRPSTVPPLREAAAILGMAV
jgi:hypothetical protein